MTNTYTDKRKAIAGEFFINDSRLKNRSKKAYKKIQIWKAATATQPIDLQYQKQIENLVRYSFFEVISSSEILVRERFFDIPSGN